MTRLDQATGALESLLSSASQETTREWWERYLKGTARFRGVPMGGIRAAVRRVWSDHGLETWPKRDLLALAYRWLEHATTEDKLAATLLLAEHLQNRLTTADAPALERPLARGHIDDWGVCDWYATKALHAFLVADPNTLPARARALASWTRAPRLWQRRAGVVAFVKLAPRARELFGGFTDLVLDACEANLVVAERFAHTGPGWVLRELSKSEPERVQKFVDEHPNLSHEARRMATARLRPGPYRRR